MLFLVVFPLILMGVSAAPSFPNSTTSSSSSSSVSLSTSSSSSSLSSLVSKIATSSRSSSSSVSSKSTTISGSSSSSSLLSKLVAGSGSSSSLSSNSSITAVPSTSSISALNSTIKSVCRVAGANCSIGVYEQNPFTYANLNSSYDPSLLSSCSSSFESVIAAFTPTGAITTTTTTMAQYPIEGVTETARTYTITEYVDDNPATVSAPCCLGCTLYGGDVQVYFWPSKAANATVQSPQVSTLVDANHFTFTSPSVYVAFQSLYATDLCGKVGGNYTSTTLGFAPGELSTSIAFTWELNYEPPYMAYNYTKADWADQTACGNQTSFFYQNGLTGQRYTDKAAVPASCATPANCYIQEYEITYDPCKPTLSVPSQLYTINPAWKSCMPGIDAFYDPPYTLTPGKGLSGFSSATSQVAGPGAPVTSTTVPAQPVATPIAPGPAQTTVAGPSQTPDPPKSNDPAPVNPGTSVQSPPAQSTAQNNPPANNLPVQSNQPPQSNNPPAQNNPPQSNAPQNNPPAQSNPPQSNSPAQNPPAQNPGSQAAPNSGAPAQPPPNSANPPVSDPNTQAAPPTPYVVASQTVQPGAAPVVASGTTYSIPPSPTAVFINNTPTPINQAPPAGSSAPYVVGTQTVTPGAAPVVIAGSTYSVAPAGTAVFVNGVPTPITQGPSPAAPTPYVVAGQTITPGAAPVVISGTTYSVAPSATAVYINGVPTPINQAPSSSAPTPYVVAGQTITPGAAPVTISGITYSIPSTPTAVFINGVPSPINQGSPITPAPYVVAGQTILPGAAPVTISGTTYSFPATGTAIYINGTPSPLPAPFLVGSQTITPGALAVTISGHVYSVPVTGGVVIDGTTQAPAVAGKSTYLLGSQTLVTGGPAITVPGTGVVSLLPGGSSVVVGGTTEPVTALLGGPKPAGGNGASTSGIGGIIVSLGGFGGQSSTSSVGGAKQTGGGNGTTPFLGGAGRSRGKTGMRWMVGLGVLWAGMLMLI